MGGIWKRADGKWVAQVSVGPRGSRKLTRRVRRSREAAKEALAKLREERGVADPKMTVGVYLRSWLATTASRTLKASTLETYEIAVRRQITPALGDLRLARLAPEHVERMLIDLGRTMKPKGVRNVLAVLSRALTVAERRGLVRRNVARLVEPPRVPRPEKRALTVEDARRIIEAVADDRLRALYILTLACGLRQAEVLGLRWEDWDRKAATIRVAYVLDRVGGRYVMVEPKSRRSRRTIALPDFAQVALRRHRRRQLLERIMAGLPDREGLIFTTPGGRPINAGWLAHRWPSIARQAGVAITFHDLRHGQASLLVALGVHPRVVAERLGHATVAMAMERYSHVAAASDREAADRLQAAVNLR